MIALLFFRFFSDKPVLKQLSMFVLLFVLIIATSLFLDFHPLLSAPSVCAKLIFVFYISVINLLIKLSYYGVYFGFLSNSAPIAKSFILHVKFFLPLCLPLVFHYYVTTTMTTSLFFLLSHSCSTFIFFSHV